MDRYIDLLEARDGRRTGDRRLRIGDFADQVRTVRRVGSAFPPCFSH